MAVGALLLVWAYLSRCLFRKIYTEPTQPDELQARIRNEVGARMKEIYFSSICAIWIGLIFLNSNSSSGIVSMHASSLRLGISLFLLGSLILEALMKRRLLRQFLGSNTD